MKHLNETGCLNAQSQLCLHILLPALSAGCRAFTHSDSLKQKISKKPEESYLCISFLPFVNQKGVCRTEACSPVQQDMQSQLQCCVLLGSI